ncbi:MAG: hypothetical protein VYA01_05185 [Bacteroidota bacterium]|jgi:hypothetical protein|nr:hypothetical protein [Bacteroidota bacterium]|tara:strand:+ start:551 stop:727 length:177 start_codon:yes stop_codon:yes gene_type:complete
MVAQDEEYSKTKDKEALDKAVKSFLKKGGKIEKVRTGMSADEYHQREPGSVKERKRGR